MPATWADIERFLGSPDWTPSEKWVIKWQFGLLDEDFARPLAECIKRADDTNLSKLGCGFPVEVKGFREWSRGDLGQRLRDAGLGI